MQKHIVHHLEKYKLIHENQSGFRKNHSCHTALTSLIEECYTNVKNKLLTGIIFADFAKAFDVIDHALLLRKLKCYNFSDQLITFLNSFLSNRKQLVTINAKKSPFLDQKYGVPQGSILGPILFSIYINDLPLEVKNSQCEMFADDTSLTTAHKKIPDLFGNLQTTLNELVSWTDLNHMALNPNKTKFMLVTNHQKRRFLPTPLPKLSIDNIPIQEVDSHVVLGVNIQKNLSWANYIDDLSKRLSKKLFQLRQIKHFLDKQTRKLFFNAYIQSTINYSSTLWDESPGSHMKLLKKQYKEGIRHVLLKSSINKDDYKSLNILPLKQQLKLNKASLIHKIRNLNTPNPLTKHFPKNENRHYHNELDVGDNPRIELFKKSLQYSGGVLWNDLPSYLKNIKQTKKFRSKYKEKLFNEIQ